ncbi:MFS transporter [Xylophilus sp. GW821-FHT01B05]
MSSLPGAALLRLFPRTEKKSLLMQLLGLVTAVEFFENLMFVFGSAHIMGGLDAAPREFVRVQAAYAVGSMLMMLAQQRLARRFGYRSYLAGGLLLFMAGLLACANSSSLAGMTAARFVQGLGGGTFFTSSRILVNLLFPLKERPAATKRFMLWIFGASALAPAMSGWLIQEQGWQWVFYAALPPAALALAGVWLLMPEGAGRVPGARLAEQPAHHVAWPLLVFIAAIVCLQLALSQARFDALEHPARLAAMVGVGAVLLGAFLWHQWQHPQPWLHLRLLHSPVYLVGLGLYFLHYFLSNFSAYLFPVFAERGLGITLGMTGWLNSFSALVSLATAYAYIRVARRMPSKKPVMLAGVGCAIAAAWLFSSVPAGIAATQLWPALLAKGMFGALLVLPVAGLTFSELGDERFGHGYQGKNLMRQLAGSVSTAVAAVLLQNRTTAVHDTLAAELSPGRPAVQDWLASVGHVLAQRGYSPEQAHAGALASLSSLLDGQSLLLACEDLYRLLALLAVLAGAVILVQRRLR